MTEKELALVKSLQGIITAIGAVHVECVATRTEDISQEELLKSVDVASNAVSEMFDSFNAYVSAVTDTRNV